MFDMFGEWVLIVAATVKWRQMLKIPEFTSTKIDKNKYFIWTQWHRRTNKSNLPIVCRYTSLCRVYQITSQFGIFVIDAQLKRVRLRSFSLPVPDQKTIILIRCRTFWDFLPLRWGSDLVPAIEYFDWWKTIYGRVLGKSDNFVFSCFWDRWTLPFGWKWCENWQFIGLNKFIWQLKQNICSSGDKRLPCEPTALCCCD